jgi:hypothetical protein
VGGRNYGGNWKGVIVKRNTLLHERVLYKDIVAHMIKKFQLLRHRSFYFLLCSDYTTTGPVPCNSSFSIRNLTKPSCALLISAVTCSCNPPFHKTTAVLNEEKLWSLHYVVCFILLLFPLSHLQTPSSPIQYLTQHDFPCCLPPSTACQLHVSAVWRTEGDGRKLSSTTEEKYTIKVSVT